MKDYVILEGSLDMGFASTGTWPGWSEVTMEGTGGRQAWRDFEPCSLKFLGLWTKSSLPCIVLHYLVG